MTANDFIGGFSLKVKDIMDLSREEPVTKWYKLLDEKRAKEHNEVILADDEVKKVRKIVIISLLQLEYMYMYTYFETKTQSGRPALVFEMFVYMCVCFCIHTCIFCCAPTQP